MIKIHSENANFVSVSIKTYDIVFYATANKSEDKDVWYVAIDIEWPYVGFSGTAIEEYIEFEISGTPTTDNIIHQIKQEIIAHFSNLIDSVEEAKLEV